MLLILSNIIGAPTANNNLGADSIINVYCHEIVETTSNYIGAWYFDEGAVDSNGRSMHWEESADACMWNFGSFSGNSNLNFGNRRFLVQQNWVPGYGCSMSLETS